MFAVIKTGGKQYKVQQGDVLQVEKLDAAKDQKITFKEILLVEDGKNTLVGTPFVDKALVHAVVVENFKDQKVIVFKKKRRKQYKKSHGHRQELTRIRIEDITIGVSAPKKAKPAEPTEEAKEVKTAAPKPEKVKKAAPAEKAKKTDKPEVKAVKPAREKKPAPAAKEKKAPAPKPKAVKPSAKKPESKAAPKKAAAAKSTSQTKK